MNEMPDDPRLLMQAAIDGELDAAALDALHRRLADAPMLSKEYEALKTLRQTLRKNFPHQRASTRLRDRIDASLTPPAQKIAAPDRRSLLRYAASLAIGAGLGGGLVYSLVGRQSGGGADALVQAHRRALLSETLVDIASNDRHNVRPWFDAHIAISPSAPDLAAQGYPLVGGRIDFIASAPAPTLVYRMREHVISVTALPASADATAGALAGYHTLVWRADGFTYCAVSDADLRDLEGFVATFRRAVEETPGETPRG